MRGKLFILVAAVLFSTAGLGFADDLGIATPDQINRLNDDLRSGRIDLASTSMNDVKVNYGQPQAIRDKKGDTIYTYGDLEITFTPVWKLKTWDLGENSGYYRLEEMPTDLKQYLEARGLKDDGMTYAQIVKEYGKPTWKQETEDKLTAYYGDWMINFVKADIIKSWTVTNKTASGNAGVLTSGNTSTKVLQSTPAE